MDLEKLTILGQLQVIYPFHLDIKSLEGFHHFFYLYEKGLIDFSLTHESERFDPEVILDRGQHSMFDLEAGDLKARLTDKGVDAIDALAEKLAKEEVHMGLEAGSMDTINHMIGEKSFAEMKDWICSLMGEIVSRHRA